MGIILPPASCSLMKESPLHQLQRAEITKEIEQDQYQMEKLIELAIAMRRGLEGKLPYSKRLPAHPSVCQNPGNM